MTTKVKMLKQKFLGIYIDENLRWTDLVDHFCNNISSKISLLRQLSTYIPTKAQEMFFQGYILPLIDYGSSTCGTTSRSYLERLSKLRKRAARIIRNAPYDTTYRLWDIPVVADTPVRHYTKAPKTTYRFRNYNV